MISGEIVRASRLIDSKDRPIKKATATLAANMAHEHVDDDWNTVLEGRIDFAEFPPALCELVVAEIAILDTA